MLKFQGTVYIKNGFCLKITTQCGSILSVNPGSVLIINQQQDIEREKRNAAEKEVIIKYLTETHKKQVDVAIKELEAATGYKVENKDGDERLRIEQCMERLGILLEKGLQIYAAIDTPDEAKALFQPLEMKYLEYQKKIELLEVKEEHSEEE